MNSTAVAVVERPTSALAMWSPEQIQVIKDLICPGANDTELELFGQVCKRTGLDPFARQIYGLMRWDGRAKRNKLSIQTSIDGFRLTAERTRKYAGQLGPQWCGPDGAWRDVWLEKDFPSAARVGVLRSDWKEPMWSVARWDSYVQKFKNKDTGGEFVSDMWQRMPDVMIAKCAESLGLRRAFPAELSGLYTDVEMAQADKDSRAPSIEDLPQFQQATVVESRSEPTVIESPTPVSVKEAARAERVVVAGRVVKDNGGNYQPTEDETERARAMVAEVVEAVGDKQGEEAIRAAVRVRAISRYKQLAKVATERKHEKADAINAVEPETLSPSKLRGSVVALEAYFPDVPELTAQPPDDRNEAF